MKVFVYGTLQRGEGNHHLLADAEFLGAAVTVRRFGMTDVGFPFMLREPALARVCGELYDIGDDAECLYRLDRLEAEGRMYDRVEGMVDCDDGRRHCCQFYVKHDDRPRGRVVPVNADGLLVWPRRNRADSGTEACER
jgi:gamma-glutamylcyclotransferase (GGCT)/AIG2-like uncharacterized protein YtfP